MDDHSKNYFAKKIDSLNKHINDQQDILNQSTKEIENISAEAERVVTQLAHSIRIEINIEKKKFLKNSAIKSIIPAILLKSYSITTRAIVLLVLIACGLWTWTIHKNIASEMILNPEENKLLQIVTFAPIGLYICLFMLLVVYGACRAVYQESSSFFNVLNKLKKVEFFYARKIKYNINDDLVIIGPKKNSLYITERDEIDKADSELYGRQMLAASLDKETLLLLKAFDKNLDRDKNTLVRLHAGQLNPAESLAIKSFLNSKNDLLAAASRKLEEISIIAVKNLESKMQIKRLEDKFKQIQNLERTWEDVALAPEVLDKILNLVDLFASRRDPAAAPKGMLLYGPPGTGKTSIAKKLAGFVGCRFVTATMTDLKANIIGGTAKQVSKIWENARNNSPCILFVDECETVFAKRGTRNSDSFNDELVQTFLHEWEGFKTVPGQVFVIGATNNRQNIDEGVLSRFTSVIKIELPDANCRKKILVNEFNRVELKIEVSDALVRATQGMSGRDLHSLATTVRADYSSSEITEITLLQAIRKYRGKSSADVDELTWDDIILKSDVINELKMLSKTVKSAETLRARGLHVPKSMLLYGPPGTGKTQIARVLANESGIAFMTATTAELKAGYIGQSGQNVKELFEKARSQSPCILFIDEIDIISQKRGDGDRVTQEIIGQLLQEMDGVEAKSGQVFVIGATNNIDDIDSAIISRFEERIEIPLPDHESRMLIVRNILASKPIDFELQTVSKKIADMTDNLSGRDLLSIIKRAEKSAMHRSLHSNDDLTSVRITEGDLYEASRDQ